MDIPLSFNTITNYKKIFSDTGYCDISAEIVVPDTQQDINRVLTSHSSITLKSKECSSGRLGVFGDAAACVTYVPEGEEDLNFLQVTIPYSSEFAVRDSDDSCFPTAEVSVCSVETKILNPRKVRVSIKLRIKAECYKHNDVSIPNGQDAQQDRLFVKSESAEITYISQLLEQSFSIENEYPFEKADGAEYKIVSSDLKIISEGTESVGAKLIVKSKAFINLLIFDGSNLKSYDFSTVFSRLFELDDDSEKSYEITYTVNSENYEDFDGVINADIYATAHLICRRMEDISFLSDAYSCSDNLNCERGELKLENDTKQTFSAYNQLQIESETPAANIISSEFSADCELFDAEKSELPLKIKVIYTDLDGKYRAISERTQLSISNTDGIPNNSKICGFEIGDYSVSPLGKTIDIRISAQVITCAREETNINYISEITIEDEAGELPDSVLYLHRAGNEDLWEIAKKYRSDISRIIAINDIENGNIAGKMLLIPGY